MRDEHYWPDWDPDPDPVIQTGEVPASTAPPVDPWADSPGIDRLDTTAVELPDDDLAEELLDSGPVVIPPPSPASRFRRGLGKVLMVTGGTIALLVLLYTADLLLSVGDVPRGVTVVGVDVGGMERIEAESRLRTQLEPRLVEPVQVLAGDVETELDPVEAGLGLDWPGTLEQAGNQPLNPVTRVLSFFAEREVGVVTTADPDTLHEAVAELADSQLDHELTEGTIRFEKVPGTDGRVRAVAVEPRQGQQVRDIAGAAQLVRDGWLGAGVEIPVTVTPPKATVAGVRTALDSVVNPMIAGPVPVLGEGVKGVLKPDVVSAALRFAAQDDGSLQVQLDQSELRDALEPQLASTEVPGKNAEIVFAENRPTVRPAEPGRSINWERTLAPFVDVARNPERPGLRVVYNAEQPEVTTEDAEKFGIKEVIGEFSTTGFSGDVARNVAAIAREVDGAIIGPGATFSLEARTGPRTASQGYVTAPVFEDGSGPRVIGGGVSQFTTTLYNAVYFAGLKDAGHTGHVHYFDRYPVGRDARSLAEDGSVVDLAFTNDGKTGIALQAEVSGGSVTVRIWGTKRFRVESSTGPRSDVTPPGVRIVPGSDCAPEPGKAGFSISDTRVFYDLDTGNEVRRETRSVRYAAKPAIFCR
ncbi:Vancomycin resistance protein YoaR, contains peptidoglycan-binding and VanW domains [Amycolatopsis marina]|uniref:Vancomycin resistance protein YoaR, contains peptidoglycan-binding and VanW domains n=1 Tax=Amycolatopsis marina TaxID=490629 RepID=A0A1I0VS78_9PSEU|nr:VanW family protein [Amycolatopsis marina]SFA78546.1 Vancomycin resistance protein YoaR, contains peptidoglycan-binding and VanW domains [Amycolatopsis marina]